jgi:uncharacterized coiled-coil protein SlyX
MFPFKSAAANRPPWVLWCTLVAALALAAISVWADTLTLKDGSVLDGDITAEDDSSVSIYLEFAHGTITETRRIDKADIARIVRSTPEQRAAEQTKRDYDALEKYRLDPNTSYRLDYYDTVISNVFREFLAQHPSSIYESNVTDRIDHWVTERDLVATGRMRFHGRWLSAAEGARLAQQERGQQLLQESRRSISQGRFDTAIRQLESALSMSPLPELVSQARPLLSSAFQQEFAVLDRQRQQLGADLSSAQSRVDRAQHAVTAAESSLSQSMNSRPAFGRPAPAGSPRPALGNDTQSFVQNQQAVDAARSTLAVEQANLDQARSQMNVVVQKLAAMQSQATAIGARWGIDLASTRPAAAPSPPPTTTSSPDILVGITTLVRNDWMYLAAGAMVILFLVSRAIRG